MGAETGPTVLPAGFCATRRNTYSVVGVRPATVPLVATAGPPIDATTPPLLPSNPSANAGFLALYGMACGV